MAHVIPARGVQAPGRTLTHTSRCCGTQVTAAPPGTAPPSWPALWAAILSWGVCSLRTPFLASAGRAGFSRWIEEAWGRGQCVQRGASLSGEGRALVALGKQKKRKDKSEASTGIENILDGINHFNGASVVPVDELDPVV